MGSFHKKAVYEQEEFIIKIGENSKKPQGMTAAEPYPLKAMIKGVLGRAFFPFF
jgi:hypothetical protein